MNDELRVKEILAERKMSIRGLAELMKVDPASLSRSLSGKMTLETLKKIAEALNIDIWELFTKPTSKNTLTALISYQEDFYKATSLKELEDIVEKIKQNI